MTEHRIRLREPLRPDLAGELSQRLYFVSETITGFTLHWAEGGVDEIVLTTAAGAADDAVVAKVTRMIAEDVRPLRPVPQSIVWRSPVSATVTDVFEELVERGEVVQTAPGQVAFGGVLTGLMSFLDSELRDRTVRRFAAREYRYPTLIPTETIRRSGYFTSFPQFLMLVTRLHADLDTYRAFQHDVQAPGFATDGLLDYCSDTRYCLPPAMCYHTYRQFQGKQLTERGLVVTACGKSFRHESRYHRSLERLWDFTIRETVFLGSRDDVLRQRRQAMELVTELAVELDLVGHCEVANDPFFGQTNVPERTWAQRLMEQKYELRLPIGAGRDVAAASFNMHDRLFGTAFDIREAGADDGDPVHTACSGVGLERLAYAFLCRHGCDQRQWPEPAREAVLTRSPSAAGVTTSSPDTKDA